MFGKAVRRGYEKVSTRISDFVIATLYYLLLSISAILAPIGAVVLFLYMLSFVGISISGFTFVLYLFGGLFFFISLLLLSGFKGALVKSYVDANKGSIFSFINYSLKKLITFSSISIIKLILHSIFLVPSLFIYYTFIPDYSFILFLVINVPIIFLIELLFSFSYIAVVVKDLSAIGAIKDSIAKVTKDAVDVVPAYLLYCGVVLSTFIPLLNIFTFFVIYPIAYRILIEVYRY